MPIGKPFIPYTIKVHLGAPKEDTQDVTVSFPEYIKNVASSEIYPTWEESAIRANINTQVSYALNRIYTEYYRSQGYDFDITGDTAVDQKFINGREIFENIDKIASELFDDYIRRINNAEPLAAKYCNGTTSKCEGLSQWGSQALATKGYTSKSILYNYYGNDIEIVYDTPLAEALGSYPGIPVRNGSRGDNVKVIQIALNRIGQNFPAIPKVPAIDGIFGPATETAVKEFQKDFKLTPDGIVGKSTWYKIIFLYQGVAKLSELNSEGTLLFNLSLEYPDRIPKGERGEKVIVVQYLLSVAADFFDTITPIEVDGVYGEETQNTVINFQRQFGLPETGEVDEVTWNTLYDVFKGIYDRIFAKDDIFPVETEAFRGRDLQYGMRGEDVIILQEYLNALTIIRPEIIPITPTGFFGTKTQTDVRTYQRLYGFEETGIVTKEVWNSIINTYKNTLSSLTSRYRQFPGQNLKYGDEDQ